MDQATIKVLQRLKDKTRKIIGNDNNKLRDTQTHTKEVKVTKI